MTAGDLHDVLARRGADLMVRALGALERGSLQFTPQPKKGVTYANKIDKTETRNDESPIYLFDRESGNLVRRIHGDLPNVTLFLTFSPDGRYLAAMLGGGRNGLRPGGCSRGLGRLGGGSGPGDPGARDISHGRGRFGRLTAAILQSRRELLG